MNSSDAGREGEKRDLADLKRPEPAPRAGNRNPGRG